MTMYFNSNRTNAVIIGLTLLDSETYDYRFIDDTECKYLPRHIFSQTDDRHCVQIMKMDALYTSVNCSTKLPFICSGNMLTFVKIIIKLTVFIIYYYK